MKLLADFHTHSKYSRFGHGKDSIDEMVHQANELGLQELAITDHGYKNFFCTSREKMKKARKAIDDINAWSKTKILLGIEANLLNTSGDLDVDEDTLELLDILVVGYHRMIKTDFAGFFGTQKKGQTAIDKVTNAYIHAIEKYPITIISHLDSVLKTDLYRIGCACRENGVMVEINNRHLNWTKEQIDELIRSDCMFVVSSDAHCRDDIGKVDKAIEFIKKYNIPTQNIANMEFTEDEMTPEEVEDQIYYDMYKQKLAEQEEKRKVQAARNGGDIKLSKEMEDALEQLANETGVSNYQRFDKEIDKEQILNDENFIRSTERAIEDMREYFGSNKSNSEEENSYQDNQDNFNSEGRTNLRETVEFNEVKKDEENYSYNDNLFYTANDSYIDTTKNNNSLVRDSSYEETNLQEQQIEEFKTIAENEVIDNDASKGNLKESYDNLFDSDIDSSSFNVNDNTGKGNPLVNSFSTINRNYVKSESSATVNVNKNYNQNNSQKTTTKKTNGFGSGNFFSETGNVLGVDVENNVSNNNVTNKIAKNNSQNVEKPTRLGNGLIDFSSLTDDE